MDGLLIEDQWGGFRVRLDKKVSLPLGTPVEVAGFPVADGLRLDLLHCTVAPIEAGEMKVEQQPEIPELTTVAAVKKLTAGEAAAALPVRVTGVVTFADNDWRQMFLQDSTGGIFVKFAGSSTPIFQGEELTVTGLSSPGDYAPVIIAPKLSLLGKGQLPRSIAMTARAVTGIMDSRFVEVEGIVRPLRPRQNPKHLVFDLYSSFGPIHVQAGPDFSGMDYIRSLEDARVHARGVCAEIFNSRRQLIGLQLEVSRPQDIKVLVPGNLHPFQMPATAINQLLRFSPDAHFDHRIKVSGVVTVLGKGFLYVQDQTGGVRIESNIRGLHVADLVDAVGYASPGGYSPMLTDAIVQVRQHDAPVTVQQVKAESLAGGQFDSQLVSIEGRLLSVVNSTDSRTLILRSGGTVFDAVLYVLDSGESLPVIQEGSVLRLTGICSADLNRSTAYMLITKDTVGFKVVIRSTKDIEVLRPAPWWNARHMVLVLSVLSTVLFASFAWVNALRRRIRRQSEALESARAKTNAIHQLTTAMQEVTRQKQFTSRVSVQGQDEITQLSIEFNKMLAELHRSDLAKSDAEAKLQQQALTDELTGLPNRRLLSDRLSQRLAMANRETHILALLYLDLDGFKLVNDSLGHTVGDLLLGQVAQRLRSRVRKSDTLARLGGDEFTVILSSLRSQDEAGPVAKSLLDVLSTPFIIENHEITISASIGISVFPDDASHAADLLQQADSAMYAAKRNGKNRFMYYTPDLGSLARERLNLENQLRGAISRGEIAVYYQPEFDVAAQRLVCFEALARWQHPTLGSIPPSRFIPIAEESGLIIPLGAFILERACEEAVKWQRLSKDPIQVAVNVSSVQFAAETFVDEVAEVLRHSQLPPNLLQIELTESVMLKGIDPAVTTMKRLRALGVFIAIDDFGTGYSCLSYLPKLPLTTLKIDRAFVMEIDKRPEMQAMMRSFITLAHNLNLQVIAEGIETVHQLEVIQALGGNQVQGFLLGRPTADPTSQLLSANQSPQPDTANSVTTVPLEFRPQ
jgi:diguanylate cyclase (GGDEF)-like protein